MRAVPEREKMGKTGAAALNPVEVERRVAILKRFRELLSQQRDRFRQYLDILDKQKNVIRDGSADDLVVHVELEEKIVGDIFAIQKVIDPLEAMYQAAFPLPGQAFAGEVPAESSDIREVPTLRAVLEELKTEAVIRSNQNRDLLAKRMEELRREMKILRANPYAIHRSVYSRETAALLDIQG
jgi:hypothetical protein